MNRPRQWTVVFVVVTVAGGIASADEQSPSNAKAGESKWLVDRALTITPRAEPQPALKFRLLPLASELKEGNAVPIYLRLNHEVTDSYRNYIRDTPTRLNDSPLDREALAEAKKFLDGVRGKFLVQLDYGARRRSAEWNYTLEQPNPIGILLPDLQSMRNYAPMLVLRARVQIAESDFAGAADSFQTGFGFSRHVSEEGPFLIGGLVGMAIATMHVDRIPEWIERPDSPNLYWAITSLPRPFISFRKQLEYEQDVLNMQFRDLADLDRPRSPAEWDATLKRVRAEARRVYELMKSSGEVKKADGAALPPDPEEPAAKSPDLPAAQAYVADRQRKPLAEVQKMPAAQVMLLHIAGVYADYRDDIFKLTYLPYPDAHARVGAAAERLQAAPDTEGGRLAKAFLPAISKVITAQVRLERKFAALRVIEALRLHTAANGGQLPDSLDKITIVPVPLDPGTGKPFEYARDGATATLVSRLPGEPLEANGLRYRITVRSN